MSRCSCNPRCCNGEGATHRFNICAVLLGVVSVAGLSRQVRGEEARAATEAAPKAEHLARPRDPFLDALSFTSNREPIAVTADELEFDYKTHVLTYKGSVVATQGDMKLQSNALTVSLDAQAENRPKEVVATGHVRLSKGTRWATGERAVFDRAQNTVVLSENAVLHDGPNEVSGDRIVVYLDQERSVVEGGSGRVKALLFPSSYDATPAAGGAAR
jgi:lipopolysaccharide export system protein LptA